MFRTKPAFVCLIVILSATIAQMELPVAAQEYSPPQRGVPGRREGAGTRGNCMQGQQFLMPLIPSDGFSTTVSKTPSFLWFVPTTVAKTAEFTILDRNDNPLYRATIPLPKSGGIVSFTLPDAPTSPLLTSGNDYYWQFSVICDPDQPSRNPFVEGVVQRSEPTKNLIDQLNKATSARDRAAIYASAGIWQDAITTLAQERCLHSQDASLLENWTRLLRSVQLQDYANAPLTNFCTRK